MTENQAPRRNPHLGTDCPPWCDRDHSGEACVSCMGSGGSIGDAWTRAMIGRWNDDPVVAVTGAGPGEHDTSHLELRPRHALHLAGLVEILANATPDQHRELVGFIRKAAADIADGAQP